MRLTVKDIAKALGLSNETIRYYVDEGLIHPVKNPDNNYWEYSSDDLIRLTDIMFYRSQGLGINEIRHIMNGLDLEDFDEVLEERKSQLIDEMHSLSRRLWSLDDWIKRVQQERGLVGKYIIGDMPVSFRDSRTFEEGIHLAKYLEDSFDIDKEDWADISISFFYDISGDEPLFHKYISVENDHPLKISANKNVQEEGAKHCLITEVHLSDDPEEMVGPMKAYAAENGLELMGTFYGKENTNYYKDGKRSGLYKVYAPLKR